MFNYLIITVLPSPRKSKTTVGDYSIRAEQVQF